jgi:predicted amino acid-binding ACT domain protein
MSRIAQKEDLSDADVIAASRAGGQRTPADRAVPADGGRHPRHRPQGVERLEGQAAGRPVPADAARAGRRRPNLDAEIEARKQEARQNLALLSALPGTEEPLWKTLEVSYFARHDAADIAWHARSLWRTSRPRSRSCARGPRRWATACRCWSIRPTGRPVRAHLRLLRQRRLQHPGRQGAHHARRLCARHLPGRQHPLDHGDDAAGYRDLISLVETQAALALASEGPAARAQPRPRVAPRASFPVVPRVTLHPDERAQRWLLTVTASDRSGLLYAIARVLARNHINLQLAKVTTLGERVEDTFLVDGPALQQPKAQLRIESELLDAVAPPPDAPTHGQLPVSIDGAGADCGLRHADRRPLAGRVRRGPPARRGQLAGARRRRARHRRHAVRAGPRRWRPASSARRWCRATSPTTWTQVRDKPREWRPLVYCWRGGQRSGSLALVLAQIGFRTAQLQGGYKAFRARVRERPEPRRRRSLHLPRAVRPHRQRQDAAAAGLRDEPARRCSTSKAWPMHRGSILGALPGLPQPSAEALRHAGLAGLAGFDAGAAGVRGKRKRPHRQPARARGAAAAMHAQGHCVRVAMPMPRASRCCWTTTATARGRRTAVPAARRPGRTARARTGGHWQALARTGRWPDLIGALMAQHYDPLYERSMAAATPAWTRAARGPARDGTPATWPRWPRSCWREAQALDLHHEPHRRGRRQDARPMELRNTKALAESRSFPCAPGPAAAPAGLAGARLADLMRCPCPAAARACRGRVRRLLIGGAHRQFWLLTGAFTGFLLVAPIVATGLYAVSRDLERGEHADLAPRCASGGPTTAA